VNKKAGPFKCMFCVGKFFGDDQGAGELQPFLDGSAKVPLPTYFVDGLPFGRCHLVSPFFLVCIFCGL
jgi:hypothetical protein